jgi:hypothetical protein
MSPLKWHAEGYRRYAAWSTEAGEFAPFMFTIEMYELPMTCVLEVRDLNHALPIVRVRFDHREWSDDMVKAFAETIRPTLPAFKGKQYEDPTPAVTEALRARWRLPVECGYVHAFPIGADDNTVCEGGHVTRGYIQKKAG